MQQNRTIKRIIGGLLLLVFTFSITPRQWLHDILAHHKDSYNQATGKAAQVERSGFHCICDELVVTSPYIDYDNSPAINTPASFAVYLHPFTSDLYSARLFFSTLRGPPASA